MRGRLIVLSCVALPLLGCGGNKLVPVSGKVTLNGKPLAGATVTFQPYNKGKREAGPASAGETNAQGEFTLKLSGKNANGAVVGEHKVSISALQGPPPSSADDNPKPRVDLVPERYNTQTELKFQVPAGGTDKADFNLVGGHNAQKGGGS
jgi:hypothetical protein